MLLKLISSHASARLLIPISAVLAACAPADSDSQPETHINATQEHHAHPAPSPSTNSTTTEPEHVQHLESSPEETFLAAEAVPENTILMFVAYNDVWWPEYAVARAGFEAAGYNVEVRSADVGFATSYGRDVDNTPAVNIEGYPAPVDFNTFEDYFERQFGEQWPSEFTNRNTIPLDGRIQDVESIEDYAAFVIPGGRGMPAYRYDGSYRENACSGNCNGHPAASAANVESAAIKINQLVQEAMALGIPVGAECHGAPTLGFVRIPGTEGSGQNGLGESILAGEAATGFPLGNSTAYAYDTLGINNRAIAAERLVVSGPDTDLFNGNGQDLLVTSTDWYPESAAYFTKTVVQMIETWPSVEARQKSIDILVLGGDEPDHYNTDVMYYSDLVNFYNDLDGSQFTATGTDNSRELTPEYLAEFDVLLYFAHNNIPSAVEQNIVDFVDNGGGVFAVHHAIWNPRSNNSVFIDLMGAELPQGVRLNSDTIDYYSETPNRMINVNVGHFVSTHGVIDGHQDTEQYHSQVVMLNENLDNDLSRGYPVYSIPSPDEKYPGARFNQGVAFGAGVGEINVIFANDFYPEGSNNAHQGQHDFWGYTRLMDPSNDGSVGRIVYIQPGETNSRTLATAEYQQTLINAVVWAADNGIVNPTPPSENEPDTNDTPQEPAENEYEPQSRSAEPCSSICPMAWNDPETWGGTVPRDGDEVTIGHSSQVFLDADTAALGGLSINGVLEFGHSDVALSADWIMLHGELHIGSEAEPFIHQASITLTGDDAEESIMGMGTRGIMVMGGVLELHGLVPERKSVRINQHAAAGTNQLELEVSPDWQVGDQIVVSPTDYYGTGHTELFTIADIAGEQVTLSDNLEVARWGQLQYVTSDGIALSPDGSVTPSSDAVPMVLDERAVVGNLTRNIVIQAPDDDLWQNQGFGAHLMIMDLASDIHVEGVEFRRVGQAGLLGRYPWHWHILSYAADGSLLGDVDGHYFRGNSVHHSANRCITIHATNGTVVEDNVCYDISGHGIFFEDATERRNRVENNLVLRTRGVPEELALKIHEIERGGGTSPNNGGGGMGSSGIWVTNPDNIVRGNHTADAVGFGLWMAFPTAPVGATSNVDIIPFRLQFGNFDNNISHSNQLEGVNFDHAEDPNDPTEVVGGRYVSTSDGQLNYNGSTIQDFYITGLQIWKNGFGGIWSRSIQPHFSQFVVADNEDIYFDGAGIEGDIGHSLVVGTSLNMPTPRPEPGLFRPTAFATYHSQFDIHDNVVVDFPLFDGEISGLFATDDYYVAGVDRGQARNSGNVLVNTHGGFRVPHREPYFTLAGAVWDPYGFWGPEENYFVYDEPFYTHAADCVEVAPGSEASGGISCGGEYYGINEFIFDSIRVEDVMAIEVTRFDEASPDTEIDSVYVASELNDLPFDHQRDFAAFQNGIFLLEFPDREGLPTDVAIDVNNMRTSNDRFVLGIAFDGNEPANVFTTSESHQYLTYSRAIEPNGDFKRNYTAVDSFEEAVQSEGGVFYQDTENNIVWIHVVGGMNMRWNENAYGPTSNQQLYREFHLKVW